MPNPNPLNKILFCGLLLLGLTLPAWSQEEAPPAKKRRPVQLMKRLGPQDVLAPITSIEWGTPDRWSFTTRYIHMFDKERDYLRWRNNFTVTLSPGTDGGRFGIGYQGITFPKGKTDFEIFTEARAVLLHTWGNPLETKANRTFVGAEIRGALFVICNIGVGWYRQISSHEGRPDSFWGFHVGFGI